MLGAKSFWLARWWCVCESGAPIVKEKKREKSTVPIVKEKKGKKCYSRRYFSSQKTVDRPKPNAEAPLFLWVFPPTPSDQKEKILTVSLGFGGGSLLLLGRGAHVGGLEGGAVHVLGIELGLDTHGTPAQRRVPKRQTNNIIIPLERRRRRRLVNAQSAQNPVTESPSDEGFAYFVFLFLLWVVADRLVRVCYKSKKRTRAHERHSSHALAPPHHARLNMRPRRLCCVVLVGIGPPSSSATAWIARGHKSRSIKSVLDASSLNPPHLPALSPIESANSHSGWNQPKNL